MKKLSKKFLSILLGVALSTAALCVAASASVAPGGSGKLNVTTTATIEDGDKTVGADADKKGTLEYTEMTFGAAGNGAATAQNDTWGVWTINEEDATLDIGYTKQGNIINSSGYMAKILFKNGFNTDHVFVRVLYSAKLPKGVASTNLYLANDAQEGLVLVAKDVKDTNGEFVMGGTFSLAPSHPGRFASNKHCSLFSDIAAEGAEFRIKALYFFPSRKMAESFSVGSGDANITINGNAVDQYQIVIDESDPYTKIAADNIRTQIKNLSGVKVPIVDHSAEKTDYEILVGRSNRELSYKKLNELQEAEFKYNRYVYAVEGNTLIISAELPRTHGSAVQEFLKKYLYLANPSYPDDINIDGTVYADGEADSYDLHIWTSPEDAENPVNFKDSFAIDDGYWQEENNTSYWTYRNGTYTVDTDALALSYLHVYEKNVSFNAKWKYTRADAGAAAGLSLRYSADDAYVRAGYDFDKGAWYVEFREATDFPAVRIDSVKADIVPDTWYDLGFSVHGHNAVFTVNGKTVIETGRIGFITPGRIAFYAENAAIAVDDADITLTSGEGVILKDIVHNKLPENSYVEGGSVYEMTDGSLTYIHHTGLTFKSIDNGYTWEKAEKWTDPMGYPNFLRLNNGELMRISVGGGQIYSDTSSDDGKTWTKGGNICASASAGNMNDKLMQAPSTGKWKNRIFYSQNYQVTQFIDGREVFCEFYYSDDNGKTWQKSDTDSWEINGNSNQRYFGECKMLVCADGTVRMYNSWSNHYTIVYSDSEDGGKTFGTLKKLEGFPCARSSMQFVRDPYGPTDTTYYMVWVNDIPLDNNPMPRSRLTLAYSTDGKNWDVLGDIWRWESNYWMNFSLLNHLVDPFVQVTEDYVIIGSGLSENSLGTSNYHHQQRQHIWSIPKTSLHAEKLGDFTDVTTANSYYDAVKFVTEKGLFNGTSATTFSPATEMTRSMFVTVLGRLDGADVAKYTTPTFKDVAAGQWYTSYVEWAAANSIVNGIGGGLYGINNNVSVEQVCVMLARYAENKAAAEASGKTLASFSDSASVSTWATDGVKWAVENGIYTGSGNILDAGAPASRALVAEMLMNYVNVYGE